MRALTDPGVHLPYLLDELLPWMADEFGVSTRPQDTVLIGQSLGGLAAINAGFQVPERIGLVLAQSSSLWWSNGPLTGEAIFAAVDEKRGPTTRFWLESGSLEALTAENRRLFETMRAHGYHVDFDDYQGGHDFACWRGGLADGLIALLSHR